MGGVRQEPASPDQNQLAWLLKPFDISPGNVRVGDKVPGATTWTSSWTPSNAICPSAGGPQPQQCTKAMK